MFLYIFHFVAGRKLKQNINKISLSPVEGMILTVVEEAGGEDMASLLNTLVAEEALALDHESIRHFKTALARLENLHVIEVVPYVYGSTWHPEFYPAEVVRNVDFDAGFQLDKDQGMFTWNLVPQYEVQIIEPRVE